MDEYQFRAEIAEIFREQDRRFEKSQRRVEKLEVDLQESRSLIDQMVPIVDQSLKITNQNAREMRNLEKLWGDFVSTYQFRERTTDQKISNLTSRVDRLEKGDAHEQ